jgi:hypothetical protein
MLEGETPPEHHGAEYCAEKPGAMSRAGNPPLGRKSLIKLLSWQIAKPLSVARFELESLVWLTIP